MEAISSSTQGMLNFRENKVSVGNELVFSKYGSDLGYLYYEVEDESSGIFGKTLDILFFDSYLKHEETGERLPESFLTRSNFLSVLNELLSIMDKNKVKVLIFQAGNKKFFEFVSMFLKTEAAVGEEISPNKIGVYRIVTYDEICNLLSHKN